MPELRKDPIVGRWVIVAKSRAKRPHDFINQPTLHAGRFCPFCEGNEDKTPGEVLAYRNPGAGANGKGWRVRVVPNKRSARRCATCREIRRSSLAAARCSGSLC